MTNKQKDIIKDLYKKAEFDITSHLTSLIIFNRFCYDVCQNIDLPFDISYREDMDDGCWLQAETTETKYPIIIDYGVPDRYDSIDHFIEYLEELTTKANSI